MKCTLLENDVIKYLIIKLDDNINARNKIDINRSCINVIARNYIHVTWVNYNEDIM